LSPAPSLELSDAAKARTRGIEVDGNLALPAATRLALAAADFLPVLYQLYRVVTDPCRNPMADLRMQGRGREARYRFIG
jgi:hypothetical protein